MRWWHSQRITVSIGGFAIAALVLAALSAGVIAAQEASPGAMAEQPSGIAASDETEPASTPTDTDLGVATAPVSDDQTGDPGESAGAGSTPRADPIPPDQPSSSPTDDVSDGSADDQPTPSPAPPSEPAATPAADLCQGDGTAPPEVEVSGTDFGTPVFDGASYIPVTTTILVTLTLPTSGACLAADWHIDIAASAMRREEGGLMPAGTITHESIGELNAPGFADAGLAPGTSLATEQTIVTGTDQTLDERHPSASFAVTLTWSPPAGALAGQYTSQIRVMSLLGAGR